MAYKAKLKSAWTGNDVAGRDNRSKGGEGREKSSFGREPGMGTLHDPRGTIPNIARPHMRPHQGPAPQRAGARPALGPPQEYNPLMNVPIAQAAQGATPTMGPTPQAQPQAVAGAGQMPGMDPSANQALYAQLAKQAAMQQLAAPVEQQYASHKKDVAGELHLAPQGAEFGEGTYYDEDLKYGISAQEYYDKNGAWPWNDNPATPQPAYGSAADTTPGMLDPGGYHAESGQPLAGPEASNDALEALLMQRLQDGSFDAGAYEDMKRNALAEAQRAGAAQQFGLMDAAAGAGWLGTGTAEGKSLDLQAQSMADASSIVTQIEMEKQKAQAQSRLDDINSMLQMGGYLNDRERNDLMAEAQAIQNALIEIQVTEAEMTNYTSSAENIVTLAHNAGQSAKQWTLKFESYIRDGMSVQDAYYKVRQELSEYLAPQYSAY